MSPSAECGHWSARGVSVAKPSGSPAERPLGDSRKAVAGPCFSGKIACTGWENAPDPERVPSLGPGAS